MKSPRNKLKKVANRGKGGVVTALWVDHWFESCSWTFYIKFVSNFQFKIAYGSNDSE